MSDPNAGLPQRYRARRRGALLWLVSPQPGDRAGARRRERADNLRADRSEARAGKPIAALSLEEHPLKRLLSRAIAR
jgi:hypothetical protein